QILQPLISSSIEPSLDAGPTNRRRRAVLGLPSVSAVSAVSAVVLLPPAPSLVAAPPRCAIRGQRTGPSGPGAPFPSEDPGRVAVGPWGGVNRAGSSRGNAPGAGSRSPAGCCGRR